MLRIFGIVVLNTKWKDCKSRKTLFTKNFTYTKKVYVHEITVVDLSKIYFLKNAKKTCKPNNRDLNRDWIMELFFFYKKSHRKCCLNFFRDIKANSSKILSIRNIFLFLVFLTWLLVFYLHYNSIDWFLYECNT